MIKKYKQYIKESLLDKLEGPTKEEIINHFKKLWMDRKLNLFDYYRKSLEYDFKGPDKKDVEEFLYGLYINKKIKLEEYYTLSRDYNLEGPSKEYIWKQYGFDNQYEPEEYFVHLTEGMERVSPNGLYYEWYKNGKRLFEQFLNPEKLFFINYSNTFRIYEILFDMGFKEFNTFFSKMMYKYFSDEINIYEYGLRIKYKY